MEIKSTRRYHYVPIRIAKIQKRDIPNAGEEVDTLNHLCIIADNVKWYHYLRKQFGYLLKKLNMQLPYDPAIVSWPFISEN